MSGGFNVSSVKTTNIKVRKVFIYVICGDMGITDILIRTKVMLESGVLHFSLVKIICEYTAACVLMNIQNLVSGAFKKKTPAISMSSTLDPAIC